MGRIRTQYRRTRTVNIRLSDEEREKIDEFTRSKGITVATFARRCLDQIVLEVTLKSQITKIEITAGNLQARINQIELLLAPPQ